MKRVLLAVLLGLGTFLPTSEAKSKMVIQQRVISIYIEGNWLRASSDQSSGLIQHIDIYNVYTGELVRTQGCDSYSCACSISGLPSGTYVGIVVCTNSTGKKQFNIG